MIPVSLKPHRFLPPTVAALAAGLLFPSHPAAAARISEPETVLYGRVVERVGDRTFPITEGQLVWTLRIAGTGGRDLNLRTQLEPVGQGRYSYRLRIPHEVLAYDLTVNPRAVGLAATDNRVQHLSITLDGRPLAIAAGATDGFALAQSRRAGAQRIDLEIQIASTDSDGDGAPDWWEDQQGLDRHDPADASTQSSSNGSSGGSSSTTPGGAASSIRTLTDWRAAWFPGAVGDLEAFAQQDTDQDGISNFLEYAFDLHPGRADDPGAMGLPRAIQTAGRAGVSFRKRAGSIDLAYHVETSSDLFHWDAAGPDLQEHTDTAAGTIATVATQNDSGAPVTQRFFRVRVARP